MVRGACYSPRRDENIGVAMLDTPHAEIGTRLEFEGETGAFRGEVVAMPLVAPGTPIPPHSHGRMPPG
jgi:glycine cleavage system aminomethyltransferase T